MLLFTLFVLIVLSGCKGCDMEFSTGSTNASSIRTTEGDVVDVVLTFIDCSALHFVNVVADKPHVADVAHLDKEYDEEKEDKLFRVEDDKVKLRVHTFFLGFSMLKVDLLDAEQDLLESKELEVVVQRRKTWQSKAFAYSVAVLISVAYINMGCALDLEVVKQTLKRPKGPFIGFLCQFGLMPIIAFALGFVFDDPALHLGLFVTGCSPGGGASNIWTVMLGGNLDLSITMTTISTLSAFLMMPLWLFSLGRLVFGRSRIVIPYAKIATFAFCLVFPLAVGILIQRRLPRLSDLLVRVLKPFALFLILFILVFGIWANWYMFRLMTLDVLLAGMGLPWLGFAFGCTLARIASMDSVDTVAVAIETGVQNTGIAIFLLWFTLDKPAGDLAAVVPVAAATMTPLPLLIALGVCRIRSLLSKKKLVVTAERTCPLTAGTRADKSRQRLNSASEQQLMENNNNANNSVKNEPV